MMVFAKVPDFRVDLEPLCRDFSERIEPAFRSHQKIDGYGGWAILSRTGAVTDGVAEQKMNATEYTKPTALCQGPWVALLHQINAQLRVGCYRARLFLLRGGIKQKWHIDSENLNFRLHIPLFTNPRCHFEWHVDGATEDHHMAADGSAYLLRTDVPHRAINDGTTPRLHLVTGVMPIERVLELAL
jgi:hypothetical protein